MIAVDTSIAVAGFGPWHRLHELAREVLDDGVAIPAHALLETWAVLTGFPPPHRAPPDVVARWLEGRFERLLDPPAMDEHWVLLQQLALAERPGAAVYDALVATTAARAGLTLVTADQRAMDVYRLVGVEHQLLGAD